MLHLLKKFNNTGGGRYQKEHSHLTRCFSNEHLQGFLEIFPRFINYVDLNEIVKKATKILLIL
jgi:hypothetical protein